MIVCLGPCCVPVHALIPLVLWAARAVLPAAWAARLDEWLRPLAAWNPLRPLMVKFGIIKKGRGGAAGSKRMVCDGDSCRLVDGGACGEARQRKGCAATSVAPPAPGEVGVISSTEDLDALIADGAAAGVPTFVDFGASWCGPCKRIAPLFARLAADAGASARFVSVDVDECEGSAEARGVGPLPTFHAYHGGEKRVGESVGASEAKLKKMVEDVLELASAKAMKAE